MTHDHDAGAGIDCSMVGGYATDALTDVERTRFERHLATCDSCQRDLRGFRDTLGVLNESVAVRPPANLRRDVLAAIRTARVEPPPVALPDPTGAGAPAVGRRRTRATSIALVAATVLVVVMAVLTGLTVQRLQTAERAASEAAADQRTQAEILAAPDVRALAFDLPNGGHGVYYLAPGSGRGMVTLVGLPDPGPDRVYQLWTFHGETVVPNAVLPRQATIQQTIVGGISGAKAAAITVEPRGGSSQPTSEPLGFVSWSS